MAVETVNTIKGYFNTGDKPTESQFANTIDTLNNINSGTTTTLTGVIVGNGSAVSTATIGAGLSFNSGTLACTVSPATDPTGAINTAVSTHSGLTTGVHGLGTASQLNVAVSGDAAVTELVKGNDSRLSDTRIPKSHTHAWSSVTGTPTTLAGYGLSISKSDVGLANVDNTADSSKTVAKSSSLIGGNSTTLLGSIPYQSNADTTSLLSPNTTTTKKFLNQTGDGTNGAVPVWSTIFAYDVGLGNVDNTSDANKPVSSAVSAALSGKSDTGHNHDGSYIATVAPGASGNVLTSNGSTWISSTSSSSGHTIQDNGTSKAARANLNFTGDYVHVSDDSGNNATVVNLDRVVYSITSDTDVYPKTAPYVLGSNGENIVHVYATSFPVYTRLPFTGLSKEIEVVLQNDNVNVTVAWSDEGLGTICTTSGLLYYPDTGWTGTTPTGDTNCITLLNYGQSITIGKSVSLNAGATLQHNIFKTNAICLLDIGVGSFGNSADLTNPAQPKRFTLTNAEYIDVVGIRGDNWFFGSLTPTLEAPATAIVGDYYLKSDGTVYQKVFGEIVHEWVIVTNLATTSHTHIQPQLSAGIVGTVPTITDNTLTLSIGQCTAALFADDNFTLPITKYIVPSRTDLMLTDNAVNYVYIALNGGTPEYRVTTDVSLINESSTIPVNTILVTSGNAHYSHWDSIGDGLTNKLHRRLVKTQRYARESGLTLSESSGNVIIGEGVVWRGGRAFSLQNAYSNGTNSSTWFLYYTATSTWTHSVVTTFNNTQYDNRTGLQTLDNGKYTINWIFRGIEDHQHGYIVLSDKQYKDQATAIAETKIPTVPSYITTHAILVGRLIVAKSSATVYIESAFDNAFLPTVINEHNDLSGLQGGTSGEYYHLTSAEKSSISGIFSNPMTTSGDTIYGGTSGVATRLAKGTDGQYLQLASGLPSWQTLNADTYHGIQSAGTPTYDNTTLTLPTSGGTVTYWYQGTKHTTNSAITLSLAAASLTANTLYYIYFADSTGVLTSSTTTWSMKTAVPVCTLWKSTGGSISLCKETHNHTRCLDWHANAHLTIGARYASGFSLGTISGSGASIVWNVNSGTIYDEDLRIDIAATSNASPGARLWYQPSAGVYTFLDQAYPFLWNSGTSRVQYILSSSYLATDLATNQYMCIWVYASPDTTRPIHFFSPVLTAPYTSAANARAETPPNLSSLGFSAEYKLLHRFIVSGSGTYQTATTADDFRTSGSLPSGGSTAPTAASVTSSPIGNIAATNVQAALEELDTEKVPTGAVTTSGLTMATAKLLGRSTASTGAIEEITVGTNLTLSGGTLSASGGSSGASEAILWFMS